MKKLFLEMRLCGLICLFSLPVISAKAQSGLNDLDIVVQQDFEDNPVGIYTVSEWQKDWPNAYHIDRIEDCNTAQDNNDPVNPTKTFQWNYPVGTISPWNGGGQWYYDIPEHNELYMSYDIMFMPGFQFSKGGKVPSVMGGTGENPNGRPTDGFAAGLMFGGSGELRYYLYYPDQKIEIGGTSVMWGNNGYEPDYFLPSHIVIDYASGNVTYLGTGQWHNITYRIVLNTISNEGTGNYDGILEAYFDGVLVTQVSHILFRNTADLKIDVMRMYTYFGGGDASWASPIDEWMRVDNILLYTFKENIDVPRGNTLSPTTRTINYWRKFELMNSTIPDSPSSLTSTAQTKSSVTLKWNDNSVNEYGFKIFRSTTSDGTFSEVYTAAANTTTFVDSGLESGSTYFYEVRAYNDVGYSDFTNVLPIATSEILIPAAPTGLIASHIDYTMATVLWTDNASDESEFELERSGPDDNTIKNLTSLPANMTSYTDNGLIMNGAYQYRIRARNADGLSAWSNIIDIVTPKILPPQAPTELKSTHFTDETISVSWNDNSSNEEEFVIMRSLAIDPASAVAIKINANDTSYTDTSLVSSTTYQYSIKAVNKAGSSSLSNKNVGTTLSLAELKRVKDGLVAYYNFGFNPDYIAYDQSGYGEPVNLLVTNRSAVRWNKDNTLDILSNNALVSISPATKIIHALKCTNQLTFECWIKPSESDFTSNSRIVSFGLNDSEVGFLLDQALSDNSGNESLAYSVRMQTGSTNLSGYPEFIPDRTQPYINLQHLSYVRDSLGNEALYLNGVKSSEGFRPNNLDTWKDNYFLRLGNESDMEHPWTGSYYSVAIYNKALSQSEIMTNYAAGPTDNIQSLDMNYQIDVYPNPVSNEGTITIKPEGINDFVPQTTLRIIDTYGKVLHQEFLFNPNSQYVKSLDFTLYPDGFYFIQVISGKRQKTAKLVVHHP